MVSHWVAQVLREWLAASLRRPPSPEACLRETIGWLMRAQDATPDPGIARAFDLRSGWQPSYPETTGYIVPTFLAYARAYGAPSARDRAVSMARWLLDVQLPCGGIPAGTVEQVEKVPTVFNTGMVILGWIAAWEETGDEAFLHAACRAGEWLCDIQDDDGAWRRGGSPRVGNQVNTYNARVAWALAQLFRVTGDRAFCDAAVRNLRWVLSQQQENGWFRNNDFRRNDRPWIHTIAYAARGLLEGGVVLGDEAFVAAARRTADAVLSTQKPDGRLAARYRADWTGEQWGGCLPGHAQMAVLWFRLGKITGDARYGRAARRTLLYLVRHVNLRHRHPGIRGGLKGSHPMWRRYGRYQYPNWGAKFLADALMAPGNSTSGRQGGSVPGKIAAAGR